MKRLLLVEDEPGLVLTLCDRLTREGYLVETSGDGESGLERAAGEAFDLVLLDVMLPRVNGLDVLREAGTEVAELAVIGGGARSRYWGETLAAAMEVPLVYLQGGEVGPALGAARLAQIAVDGGTPAEVCVAPPVSHRITPDAELTARLAPKKAAFRAAYARIAARVASPGVAATTGARHLGEMLIHLVEVTTSMRSIGLPIDETAADAIASTCLRACGISESHIVAAAASAAPLLDELPPSTEAHSRTASP